MMDQDILREAEAYCSRTGIKLPTLGVRALNNSRFFDRLLKKREQADEAAAKLRSYMAAHPASTSSDEAAA